MKSSCQSISDEAITRNSHALHHTSKPGEDNKAANKRKTLKMKSEKAEALSLTGFSPYNND